MRIFDELFDDDEMFDEDIYTEITREEMFDDDKIKAEELAFMSGWDKAA